MGMKEKTDYSLEHVHYSYGKILQKVSLHCLKKKEGELKHLR